MGTVRTKRERVDKPAKSAKPRRSRPIPTPEGGDLAAPLKQGVIKQEPGK